LTSEHTAVECRLTTRFKFITIIPTLDIGKNNFTRLSSSWQMALDHSLLSC